MYHNKQWLKNKYFNEKLLMREIAILCNVQRETIAHWFKRFGFKGRSMSECHKGEWNGRYKTGKQIHTGKSGNYIMVQHNGKRVREHRLVMEQHLKRKLKFEETIHHKDGNTVNNNITNLQLFQTRSAHQRFENTLNTFAKQILFGSHKPLNHKELLLIFNNILSKNGQDIST